MKLTKDYQLLAQTKLGNTGYGNVYIRIYGKYNSQDILNNSSNISLQARIYTEGSYWYVTSGTTYRITGSGSIDSGNVGCNNTYQAGETTLGTKTKDVSHNSDGTRTIHAEANFTSQPWGWNATASATNVELPAIPRYANFTSHYISNKTENSISITWSSDATCDLVQYQLNGGSWVNTSGNTYKISNLKSGTTYSIKTRIRRTDSQLLTESNKLSETTEDYVVKVKVNGIWKNAIPYVKVNGIWKKVIPYVKVNGIWKKSVH